MKGDDKSNSKIAPYESNIGATRYDTETNLLKTEPGMNFAPTEPDVVALAKAAV